MPSSEPIIDVVIPALNEAQSVGAVVDAIPDCVRRMIVVDNGSTDHTARVAAAHGAIVVHEPRRGYGAACLRGLSELDRRESGLAPPEIVTFLDADRSDVPDDMTRLIEPIVSGAADLVIGSRVLGDVEPGALTMPQRFGNALASSLIRRIWRVGCTDLGPFRAIRFTAIKSLRMNDLDYGWTVQMQVRAARMGLRIVEVPVSYRRRIGRSKISGTVRGVVGAGTKILGTIAREAVAHVADRRTRPPARETLIVFTRLPVPGRTKTRLIPALGADRAAALQEKMTRHTLSIARQWRESAEEPSSRAIEVRYTGGSAEAMQQRFGNDLDYVQQGEGSLGERMDRAIRDHALNRASAPTVIIGSDCPGITPRIIRRAFAMLSHSRRGADIVIGPADDGGYYLIGMLRPQPAIFAGIEWGSGRVLAQTKHAARDVALHVAMLELLCDVDEPKDIKHWSRIEETFDASGRAAELSIIIPTLNEAAHIEPAIRSAAGRDGVEIIVVDGGSGDATVAIAERLGARVVNAAPGRAAQLNAGGASARGDVLLFLHADTRLPFGYREEVNRILSRPNVVAGAFRFALDHVSHALRLIEAGTNWRSKYRQLPYGDQALFMPRSVFTAVGGFPDQPVMEDYELVRALRRRGGVELSDLAVITSARRWLAHGAWRTTLRHQRAILSHHLGASPERIATILKRSHAAPILPREPGAESLPEHLSRERPPEGAMHAHQHHR